jgi:hypothetical protein
MTDTRTGPRKLSSDKPINRNNETMDDRDHHDNVRPSLRGGHTDNQHDNNNREEGQTHRMLLAAGLAGANKKNQYRVSSSKPKTSTYTHTGGGSGVRKPKRTHAFCYALVQSFGVTKEPISSGSQQQGSKAKKANRRRRLQENNNNNSSASLQNSPQQQGEKKKKLSAAEEKALLESWFSNPTDWSQLFPPKGPGDDAWLRCKRSPHFSILLQQ